MRLGHVLVIARKVRAGYPGGMCSTHESRPRVRTGFRERSESPALCRNAGQDGAVTAWQVHAYVLLPNCFHLVFEEAATD